MKTRVILAAFAAGAALNLSMTALGADQIKGSDARQASRVGHVEKANELIGRNVVNNQGEKIGDLADFAVDLESGRILYFLVSSGGFLGVGDELSAIPPGMFQHRGNRLMLNVSKDDLEGAPKFNKERAENLGDARFTRQIYSHYGHSAPWLGRGDDAKFGNVHLASRLLRAEVNNPSGERIGSVHNLAAEVGSERVLFVILNPARALDEGSGHLYAVPPMAFTAGDQKNILVTDLDRNRIDAAPRFRQDNWQEITRPGYAANVYRFYGKDLYSGAGESYRPTGRGDLEVEDQDREGRRDRQARDQRQQRREQRRGARAEAAEGIGAYDFGPIIGAESLMGWHVQGPGGTRMGKLQDLVVDLESGRLLYGVIDERGVGARDNHAVAPGAFKRVNENNKLIHAEFGVHRLEDAPIVPRGRNQYADPSFVEKVYRFYGEQPWWIDRSPSPTGREGSGKFGNVYRSSDLVGMNVQNVTGENLGKVHNVMVDLTDGRLAYVLLDVEGDRDGRQFIAVPPMALTSNQEGRGLTINLDGEKLRNAPRVAQRDLQKLDQPSFATEVYRFFGKDIWWRD